MTHTATRHLALAAATVGAVALLGLAAAPASAQEPYGDSDYQSGYGGPGIYTADEEVEVTAPPYYRRHHHPRRSAIGAPIVDVAMSSPVRFDDLDLTTRHGAQRLRLRVRETARDLCHRLDLAYPVSAADSPPCYRTALDEAMPQANAAIRQARYARGAWRPRDDDYRD